MAPNKPSGKDRSLRPKKKKGSGRPRKKPDDVDATGMLKEPAQLETIFSQIDDMDISMFPLGVLLNSFVLKPFMVGSGKEGFFRGKIVSYYVPPTNVSAGRILPHNLKRKKDCKPLDFGLYTILFDDGDKCDMDPLEAYKWVELYNAQRDTEPRKRLRRMMSQPGSSNKSSDCILKEENQRLDCYRTQRLSFEILLYFHFYREYFQRKGIDSLGAWSKQINWSFDSILLPQSFQTGEGEDERGRKRDFDLMSRCSKENFEVVCNQRMNVEVECGNNDVGNSTAMISFSSSQTSNSIHGKKGSDIPIVEVNDKSPANIHCELPVSSRDWIRPYTMPSSFYPVDHLDKDLLSETATGAFQEKLPPPNLPARILTIPSKPEHQLVLSVGTSYIQNAGNGLFACYCGPNEEFVVPGYIDLGRYGPHRAADIKDQLTMEAKNFVFDNKPSEWSFEGPPSFEGHDVAYELYGKSVDQHVMFDITSDEEGLVHKLASVTLLPFANEVLPDNDEPQDDFCVRGGPFEQPLNVQNLDAAYHDDGSVHYLLRTGVVLKRDKKTELLVDYGKPYDGVRQRKYFSSVISKSVRARDCPYCLSNRSGRENFISEEVSTITSDSSREHVDASPPPEYFHKAPASVAIPTSVNAPNNTDRLPQSPPKPGMCYQSMYTTISTYTEMDILRVLGFFLDSPPLPSLGRKRMKWVVKSIYSYAIDVLYQSPSQVIPIEIVELVSKLFQMFPREGDNAYSAQDAAVDDSRELLGSFVRKEFEGHGLCLGVVQEVVAPLTAVNIGRDPGSENQQSRVPASDIQYRVSFSRLQRGVIMSGREINEYSFNQNRFLLTL